MIDPATLREAWARSRSLRVPSVLDEAFAEDALEAMRAQPHGLSTPDAPPSRGLRWTQAPR